MSLKYENMAYDLSLFENRGSKNKVLEMPRIKSRTHTVKVKRVSFRAKVLAFFIFCVVALTTIIFNQIQLTELTDKIRIKNSLLAEKNSIYTQLEVQRSAKFSSESLEDYAKDKLNMQKTDPSQVEYVTLHN